VAGWHVIIGFMEKPRISLVAAIGKNNVLGKDNKLIWHIPEDMNRFKTLTSGFPIIMGRKTFESIGRPLPNRTNIVISRDPKQIHPDAIMASSIVDAFEKALTLHSKEIFVIGGSQIYHESMPYADRIYLTIINASPEGDTFFPDYSNFKKVVEERKSKDANYSYTFYTLDK
jgi:dihydrofolate reductase